MKVAYGLLALAFSGASWLDAVDNYFVEGIVVDSQSHAPLANARVVLAPSKARDRKTEQVTKRDGRFSFPVGLAGKYSLKIAKSGYPPQDYKQAGFSRVESAIVIREDQDTRHIVFEAVRGSAVAGQIKDEDSEPVGRALVAIFQSVILDGERKIIARGQTHADAAGEFRFRNLPRGNYYVCAMGRPWFADSLIQLQAVGDQAPFLRRRRAPPEGAVPADPSDTQPAEPEEPPPAYSPDPGFRGTAFMTTFYPNAQTVEAASVVRAEPGSETQVSITLPLTRAVSVKGAISVSGEITGGRAILYKKIYNRYMSFLEEWVTTEGRFEFNNVPAGSYEIVASSQASSGPASWNIRQEVEVGATDLEIQIQPPQMGSFSGRILFDSEPPSSAGSLFVVLRNERDELRRTEVAPDGAFSFSRLSVGRYEISVGSANYIAAYLKDPDGERLSPSFEIASGATVHHDLVLTGALSVIEGTVEQNGVPRVGAFVLLLPKNPSERRAYRIDQTDSDGSYRLATIRAGDYWLIALSDGEDVAYRDTRVAALLAQAAKLVHVDAGNPLDLKLDVVETANLKLPSL